MNAMMPYHDNFWFCHWHQQFTELCRLRTYSSTSQSASTSNDYVRIMMLFSRQNNGLLFGRRTEEIGVWGHFGAILGPDSYDSSTSYFSKKKAKNKSGLRNNMMHA